MAVGVPRQPVERPAKPSAARCRSRGPQRCRAEAVRQSASEGPPSASYFRSWPNPSAWQKSSWCSRRIAPSVPRTGPQGRSPVLRRVRQARLALRRGTGQLHWPRTATATPMSTPPEHRHTLRQRREADRSPCSESAASARRVRAPRPRAAGWRRSDVPRRHQRWNVRPVTAANTKSRIRPHAIRRNTRSPSGQRRRDAVGRPTARSTSPAGTRRGESQRCSRPQGGSRVSSAGPLGDPPA